MTGEDRWVRRYRWHLAEIPGLLMICRQTGSGGLRAAAYGERVSGGSDVRRLPFQADGLDDADLLWAVLVLYGREVAELFGGSSPSALRYQVWSRLGEPQGLPPGLSPEGAWSLGDVVCRWLSERALSAALFSELEDSEEHLFALVRALRARYGLVEKVVVAQRPRRCGLCGYRAVVASYETVAGRERSRVWCKVCGAENEGVTEVGRADVSAGRAEGAALGENDQAVAAERDADGHRRAGASSRA